MQLKNDEQGWNNLRDSIRTHYKEKKIDLSFFSPEKLSKDELEVYFLIGRKHVAKYVIGTDRKIELGVLLLAIGPHYFSPADFGDYPNSQRFKIEASTEAVEHNLQLLDEFFGYTD